MSELYAPLERRSAPQVIADCIRDAIQKGEFPVGTRLPSERDLAERMSVSRPVVREALTILSSRGLIAARQGGGNFVTDRFAETFIGCLGFSESLTAENYPYFFDCRRLFEVGTLSEILRNMTPAVLSELKAINSVFRTEVTMPEYVEAEIRFHSALIAVSGNPLITELYKIVIKFMHQSAAVLLETEPIREEAYAAHTAILHALERKDEAAAAAAVSAHLETARKNMQQYYRS